MHSSSTDSRVLKPFISDVPYHIQMVFIVVFGLIWYNAFVPDAEYLLPLPEDAKAAELIVVGNWWRGIYAVVLFLCVYSYLKPDALDFFHPI
jgi:hypothetical protein